MDSGTHSDIVSSEMGSINFNDAIQQDPVHRSNFVPPEQPLPGTIKARTLFVLSIPKRGIEKFGAVDLSHFKKRVRARERRVRSAVKSGRPG